MKMLCFRFWSILLSLFLLIFTACNKEEDSLVLDTSDADLEAMFDDSFEEVDAIVEASMLLYDVYGRIAEETEGDMEILIGCAVKNHDIENKSITIDFGDGCIGLLGRVRKGKILITYTDRMFMPGSKTVVTFDGFSVNDIQVEGKRTMENVAATLSDPPRFHVMLEAGKLTWPEEKGGGHAERVINQYRTWVRAMNPLNDEFHVEGTANGKNRKGVQYETEILTPVKYKRACWVSGVFIPVEGVKKINAGGREVLIDFGAGDCDREITVTVNGDVRQYQHRWPGE